MKRDHDNLKPFLLPVSGNDLAVLREALSDYAVKATEDEDNLSAWRAVRMLERAANMHHIDLEQSRQALASLGIGFSRGRPQG